VTIKTLSDGTTYTKAHAHDWEDKTKSLKGVCFVYRKIDGVRALRLKDNSVVSRDSKPLYNLDHLEFKDCEVFSVNWNNTVSLVRTQSPQVITQDMIYELRDSFIDPRLLIGKATNPSNENLRKLMEKYLVLGDEGLIVRVESKGRINWWKIVPYKYMDLKITGFKEGTGKNKGMLGSFKTSKGSVGTGFTDEQRIEFWKKKFELLDTYIEVKYREVTEEGKLRFPSFVRQRFDKAEESYD
jgi:hypothetical protein